MKKFLFSVGLMGIGLVLGLAGSHAMSSWEDFDGYVQRAQMTPGRSTPAVTGSPVARPGEYRFSGPYTHENLTVYLIHGAEQVAGRDFLTLQEGLERNLAVVHETGNVGQLEVENLSPTEELFVQSGDIVKGGKQDRALQYDLLLGPNSGKVALTSFCVEQGRWSPRGAENARRFSSSSAQLATKDLKLAAKYKRNQSSVWSGVSSFQFSLSSGGSGSFRQVQSSESTTSLQLTLESPKVQEAAQGYCLKLTGVLDGQVDALGYVFAINGQVNSGDVYGSTALFRKLWPKLLKASAVEAVASRRAGPDVPAVPVNAIRAFLADAENGSPSTQTVGDRIEVLMQETERNLLFETRERQQPERWVHRSYLAK
jgi:hypothetical protein